MGNQHGKDGTSGARVKGGTGSATLQGAPSGEHQGQGEQITSSGDQYQTPPTSPQDAAMLSRSGAPDVGRTSRSLGGYGRQGSGEGGRQYGRRGQQHFRSKREEPTEMGGAAIMKQGRIDTASSYSDISDLDFDEDKKRTGDDNLDSSSDTQQSRSRIQQVPTKEPTAEDKPKKQAEGTKNKPGKTGGQSKGDPPRRGGHYARFHEALASSRSSHTESSDTSPAPVTSPTAGPGSAGAQPSPAQPTPGVGEAGRQYSEEEYVSQATVVQQAKSALPEISPKAQQQRSHQQRRTWSSDKPAQQSAEKKPLVITTSTDDALNQRLASLMQVAGGPQTTSKETSSTQQAQSSPAVTAPPSKVSPRPSSIGPSVSTPQKAQVSPRPISLGPSQAPAPQQPSPRSANISSSTDEALNKRLGSLLRVASSDSGLSSPSPSPGGQGNTVSPRAVQPTQGKTGPSTQSKPTGVRSPRSSLSGSEPPAPTKPKELITTSTDDALTKRLGSLLIQAGNSKTSKEGIVTPSSTAGPIVSSQAKKPQFVPATLGPQGYVQASSSKPKYFPATSEIDKPAFSGGKAETLPAGRSGGVSPGRPITRLQQLSLSAQDYTPITSVTSGDSIGQQEQRRRTSAPHTTILSDVSHSAPTRRGSDQALSVSEQSNVPSLTPYQRRSPMPLSIPEIQQSGEQEGREGIQSQVKHLQAPTQEHVQTESLLAVVTQPSAQYTKSPVSATSPSKPSTRPQGLSPNSQFAKFHQALATSRTPAPSAVQQKTELKSVTTTTPAQSKSPRPATKVPEAPTQSRAVPVPSVTAAKKAPPLTQAAASTQKAGQTSPFSSPKFVRATKLEPLNVTAAQAYTKQEPNFSSQAKSPGGVTARLRDRQQVVKTPPPHIAGKIANLGQHVSASTTKFDAEAVTPSTPTVVYAFVSAPEIPETSIELIDVISVESEKPAVETTVIQATPKTPVLEDKKVLTKTENKTRVGSAMQRLAKKASGETDKEKQTILNKAAKKVDYQPSVLTSPPEATVKTQQELFDQPTSTKPVVPTTTASQVVQSRVTQTTIQPAATVNLSQKSGPSAFSKPGEITRTVSSNSRPEVSAQRTVVQKQEAKVVSQPVPAALKTAQYVSKQAVVAQQPQVSSVQRPQQAVQTSQQQQQRPLQKQVSQTFIETTSIPKDIQPKVDQSSRNLLPVQRSVTQPVQTAAQKPIQREFTETRIVSTPVTLPSKTAEDTVDMSQCPRPRRTPERTMSLQERRVTPEREERLARLKQKIDQPDAQLMKILNRRSKYMEDWESQLAEGPTQADRSIEEYERKLEAEKENRVKKEVPVVDTELKGVLKSRRGESIEEYEKRLEEEKENKIKSETAVLPIKKPILTRDQGSIEQYEQQLEQEKETRFSRAADIADKQLKTVLQAKQDQEKEEAKTEESIEEYEKKLEAARERRISSRTAEIADKKLQTKLEKLRQDDSKASLIKQSSIEEYEKQIEADKEKRMSHAADVADRKLQSIFQAKREQEDDKYISTKEKVEARTALIQQSQADLGLSPQQQQQPDKQQPQQQSFKSSATLTKSSSLDSEASKPVTTTGGLQVKSILKKRNSEDNRATPYVDPLYDTQYPMISSFPTSKPKPKGPETGSFARKPKPETTATPSDPDRKAATAVTPKRLSGVMKKAMTFDNAAQDADQAVPLPSKAAQGQDKAKEIKQAEPTPTIEVSPAEVIMRPKKDLSPEEQEEEDEKRLSVAERIFQMQTKLEEGSYTPRQIKSGGLTPKMKLEPVFRSIPTSPGLQKQQEEDTPLLAEGQKLLEKLSDVAMVRDVTSERRKRFQAKSRDDQRRMTQPVTLEELRRVDSLESVSSFRSEVLSNASDDIFEHQKELAEQQKSATPKKLKGMDVFPGPFKPEKPTDKLAERRRSPRFKTQPITNLELGDTSSEPEGLTPKSIKETTAKYLEETKRHMKSTLEKNKPHHKSLSDLLAEEQQQQAEALNIDVKELEKTTTSKQPSPPTKTPAYVVQPMEPKKKTIEEIIADEERARAQVLQEKVQLTKPEVRMEAPSKPAPKVRKLVRSKTLEEILAEEEAERAKVLQEQSREAPKPTVSMRAPQPVTEPQAKPSKQMTLEELIAEEEREKAQVLKEQLTELPKPSLSMQSPTTTQRDHIPKAQSQKSLEELIAEEEREKAQILREQMKDIPKPQVRMEAPSISKPSERKIVRSKTLEEILAQEEQERAAVLREQMKEAPKPKVTMNAPVSQRHPVKKLVRAKTLEEIIAAEEAERAQALREEYSESPKPETNMAAPVVRREKTEPTKPRPKSMQELLDNEEQTRLQALREENKANLGLSMPTRQVSTSLRTPATPVTPTTPAVAASDLDSDDEFDKLVERNYQELKTPKGKPMTPEEKEQHRRQERLRAEAEAQLQLQREVAAREQEMIQFTMSMDVPENDSSRKSLDEKKTMFNKSNRRFQDKKRLDRPKTQPITGDEVHKAAELNGKRQESTNQSMGNIPQNNNQVEESEDELSNLSLSDKMKLFAPKQQFGQATARQLQQAPVMKKKSRRGQSRFQTQSMEEGPVTTEEVQKAKVSPLAMSMVKPPDPEVLQGMSTKEQQEYMAQYAEETLGSAKPLHFKPSNHQVTGTALETKENTSPRGILKSGDSVDQQEVKGILKSGQKEGSDTQEVQGILKTEHQQNIEDSDSKEIHGILKKDSLTSHIEPDHGILKKESPSPPEPDHSILKRDSLTSQQEPDHGILKHDTSVESEDEVHSILKKDSPAHEKSETTRGILKKESSFESGKDAGDSHRGIIKKQSSFEIKLQKTERSSLRRDSGGQWRDSSQDETETASDRHQELISALKQHQTDKDSDTHSEIHGILRTKTNQRDQPGREDSVTMETTSVSMVTTPLSHKQRENSSADDGDSSSSERYSHIKNPAVLRRRMQKEFRKSHGDR